MLRRIVFILALVSALPFAHAQSVHWETGDNGPNSLQLVFDDCSPDGNPQLPTVPGVTFSQMGTSQSTNIVNFNVRSSFIITYLVRARQSGPINIPAFTVETNKGRQRVAAIAVDGSASATPSVASARLIPERTTVWAGEVFGLTYELSVASSAHPQSVSNFDWDPAPLTIEEWSKPAPPKDVFDDGSRVRVIYRTRAAAKTPNTVKLEAANQVFNIQTGTVGFGFFTQSRMEPISVTSDQPVIHVRALPAPPVGFSGAVGDFQLVSKVVPEKAAVGEPVTWTLELSGTGNWPDFDGLPARDVSRDFQVVQPKAKRTPAEGKLFDVTLSEDVVLVPTKAGSYTLGPVRFTYFDPKSGTYKTLTTDQVAVTITPPEPAKSLFNVPQTAAATPPAAPPAAPSPELDESKIENLKAKIPAPPAAIPRDPLPGSDPVRAPLPGRTLLALVLAPLALPLVTWAWLAIRRAQRTDPARPRREARARLAGTIARLRDGPPSPPLLLAWQRDAAALWQIAHAAPPASALPDTAWTQLWAECDRALYGAKAALPSDWTARAEAALAAARVPGFNPIGAFLPRNLFPFAALLVFSLIAFTALRAAAEDGATAYGRGDYPAAEKAWRAAIANRPTDWIARHNLALALVQQDRAGEAAAEATAAFVQHPSDASTRWHLVLTGEKAGYAAAPLGAFLNPTPAHALAEQASPAAWQLALAGASTVIALALAWLLVNAYGRRSRLVARVAWSAVALGVLFMPVALNSLFAYGETADARAVIVWRTGTLRSIPTEADTTQKTSTLPAGSVALADKTFLGWTRLAFTNGQTGWVRTSELIALWR